MVNSWKPVFGGGLGPPCPGPSLGAISACQVGFFSQCKSVGMVETAKGHSAEGDGQGRWERGDGGAWHDMAST